jgi:hypothetical protein
MLLAQDGGSHEDGPSVGNGGYCEATFVEASSHEMEHGGVKMVVSAASGGVNVSDMVICGYCLRWRTD